MNSELATREILVDSEPTSMELKRESEREIMEPEQEKQSPVEEDATLREMLTVEEKYIPLLTLLEQFSPGEDGIQISRKLRHFETTISSMCPDETHLQNAFATFRAAALLNSETARKLALVGAFFTNQQRLQILRRALLNVVMQETFSKLDVLERSNPIFLINAASFMGDFLAEARMCNGEKVLFLASPLLQYMRALLGSDDIRAHRCLATQLMQNGRELLSVVAQEVDELSKSIRLRLLSPPPINTIWLLISADLCLHKFLPLPNTLQQFYAAHIEPTTEENFSEVDCSWIKSPEKDDCRPSTSEIAEKVSANLSQINLNSNEDAKPKQALSVSEDTFDNCTGKDYLKKRFVVNTRRPQAEEKKGETTYNQAQRTQSVRVPDYLQPKYNKKRNGQSQKSKDNVSKDEILKKLAANNYLKKRHDLNTWREQGAEKNEVEYNQAVLPPNLQSVPVLDPIYNEQRICTSQKSKDNVSKDEERENLNDYSTSARMNRKSRGEKEGESVTTPPRRHVTEVPRNTKYWGHDDRYDKGYNS